MSHDDDEEDVNRRVPHLSLGVINDALEYHSHAIVNGLEDNGAMKEHWKSLQYFWKMSKPHQFQFGRIHHRVKLAELVFYGCNQQQDNTNDEEDPLSAMVHWGPQDWALLEKKYLQLLQSCKREDANLMIRSLEDERPQEHERAGDVNLFGKSVQKLVRHIAINKHLSHFRLEMEEWMLSSSREQPHIEEEVLMRFRNEVEGMQDEDPKVYHFLHQFLSGDSTEANPTLASMDDLEGILKNKPCNLEIFQADLLSVAMNWNKALFQSIGEPTLSRIKYGDAFCEALRATDDEESDQGDQSMGEENDEKDDRSIGEEDENEEDRKPAARTSNSGESIHDLRHARDNSRQSAPDSPQESHRMAGYATLQPEEEDEGELPIEYDDLSTQEEEVQFTWRDSPPRRTQRLAATSRQEPRSRKKKRPKERGRRDDDDDDDDSEVTESSRKKKGPKERGRRDDDDDDDVSEVTERSRKKNRSRERGCRDDDDDDEWEDTEPSPRRLLGRNRSPARAARHDRDRQDEISEQSSAYKRRRRRDKQRAKKRKSTSAHRMRFESSGEDDDDVNSVRISELKPQRGSRGMGKRKFFSAQEKEAIKKGLRRHGYGKWVDILNEFPTILGERTNVQIKDCVRTMKKNGELSESEEEEE